MYPAELPRPARKMWMTRLRWHRSLRHLVPTLSTTSLLQPWPSMEEVLPYGEYLVLEDHAYVLHRDGTITVRVHLLTLLWSDEALAQWDVVQRVYHPRQMRISLGKALLHLPDGRNVKQHIQRASDANGQAYLAVHFQPLRPGVVLEFQEQVDHFRPDMIGPAMWGNFLLRTAPPCRHRRLIVAADARFHIQVRTHHEAPAPHERHVAGYRVLTWELHDVPGIATDELMPHAHEFLPWVDFSTVTSWQPVNRHLCCELLPREDRQHVQTLLAELTTPDQSREQKLHAVYRHVAQTIRYGRSSTTQHNRQVRSSREVTDELRGDCKDKSALLMQLLHQLEIPAQIAVVSTAEAGRVPYLPSMRFNHALVRAQYDGKELWIDPAAGPYTLGDLPSHDQGIQALIIDSQKPEVVTTPAAQPENHGIEQDYYGHITDGGNCELRVNARFYGDRAAWLRQLMLEATHNDRLKLFRQELSGLLTGAELLEVDFGTLEKLELPLQLSFQIRFKKWIRWIHHVGIARWNWTWALSLPGALTARRRSLPLMTPSTTHIVERYHLSYPDAIKPYGIPYACHVGNQWLDYSCRIFVAENRLQAERSVRFHGGVVEPKMYSVYRRAWNRCSHSDARPQVFLMQSHNKTKSP